MYLCNAFYAKCRIFILCKYIYVILLHYSYLCNIIILTNKKPPGILQDHPSGTQKERHPNYNTGEKVKAI